MNVSPSEKLTRFIRYSSYFSVVTNRVKPDAFLPHKKSMMLSPLFRISELTDSEKLSKNEIWEIGRKYFKHRRKSIKARDLSP